MSDERATTEIDHRLGARIRRRRRELGMSQKQLAALLGITFQQIRKYENGANRIAASRLIALSRALRTSLFALYDGHAPATPQSEKLIIDDVMTSAEACELVKIFARVSSPLIRKKILGAAQMIAAEEQTSRSAS